MSSGGLKHDDDKPEVFNILTRELINFAYPLDDDQSTKKIFTAYLDQKWLELFHLLRFDSDFLPRYCRSSHSGAVTYPDYLNWQKVDNGYDRYRNALGRHLLAHFHGEEEDADSGLSHLDHAAWNLYAVAKHADAYFQKREEDRR